MDRIFEAKEYVLKFYARYSRYVDMTLRFVLVLLTFLLINENVGFLKPLAHPALTVGLAVICTFLSLEMTTVLAALLILIHLSTLAPGVAIVAAVVMVVMFTLYFRFSTKKAAILLFTALAFALRVPVLVPVIFGLLGTYACAVPIVFGIVMYYMLSYVESYVTVLETVAKTGVVEQMSAFAQQFFANKEMWLVIISYTITLLIIYNIKRLSVDHAWEIAAVVGVLSNLIMLTFGHVLMDVPVRYLQLILGSALALAISFVLRMFAFSVDYTRSEYLQFEDDEYYYYVKAVPKVTMSVREKTVKKIHIRKETEAMDLDAIRKAADESNVKELQETAEEREQRRKREDSEIQRLIEEELNK
ncbi:MAG: hypothetical protein UHS49_00265 [Faecalimonas sp.]|nr:hypothetical protein [Faecalimonas sp.]